MNNVKETKSEIKARIEELRYLDRMSNGAVSDLIQIRTKLLEIEYDKAAEDIETSILASHKAICQAKQMGETEAYGNDPAVYYTLGVCGESGELANNIVKSLRNGWDKEKLLEAVKGELPDVIIYSYILAHVLEIDLAQLVSEKAKLVAKRAQEGYYGGPLNK